MSSLQPRRCERCHQLAENVDLRQSDEMLCQKCAAKDEINMTSQTSQVDFKIMYVLYENLIDKLKIKCKATKGKPKVRFRWKGNVDDLRDFVSLVLKKSGTWYDTRKSTKTFKTANLTVMYYMNTLTLQLRGNKAPETSEFLINLKETASSIKNKKGVLDSSSDTIPSASIDSKPEQYPVQDPHEECEYDTNDTSSQTGLQFLLASHRLQQQATHFGTKQSSILILTHLSYSFQSPTTLAAIE